MKLHNDFNNSALTLENFLCNILVEMFTLTGKSGSGPGDVICDVICDVISRSKY